MSTALVSWTRPAGEAKNTRLPKTGPLIQDLLRPSDLEFESAAKSFERDEVKARQLGAETFRLPGYRRMADKLRCCQRTAFSRMKRLRELGLAAFERRYEPNGAPAGTFMASTPWKAWLDDQKQNPQIAKTPAGEIIVRNNRPLSIEEAERLGIRCTAAAPPAAQAKAKPKAAAAPGAPIRPNVAAISAVLHRFEIMDDQEASGALRLLIEARAAVPDIAPEDLAAELGADLQSRAKYKAQKREKLSINVPYVSTFICSIARKWAAWRDERRREASKHAETATRAHRTAEQLAASNAYEQFTGEAMDRWIAGLDPAAYAALIAGALPDVKRQFPQMTPAQQHGAAANIVRHEQKRAAGLPSFEEWRRTWKPPDTGPPDG